MRMKDRQADRRAVRGCWLMGTTEIQNVHRGTQREWKAARSLSLLLSLPHVYKSHSFVSELTFSCNLGTTLCRIHVSSGPAEAAARAAIQSHKITNVTELIWAQEGSRRKLESVPLPAPQNSIDPDRR